MSACITDQKILETYARIEAEHGGERMADAKAVLTETAETLGIRYERARDAVLTSWGMAG